MIWLSGGVLKTECSRIVATLFRSKLLRLYQASRKTPRACPENSKTDNFKIRTTFYSLYEGCKIHKHQLDLKADFSLCKDVFEGEAKNVIRNAGSIKERETGNRGGFIARCLQPDSCFNSEDDLQRNS